MAQSMMPAVRRFVALKALRSKLEDMVDAVKAQEAAAESEVVAAFGDEGLQSISVNVPDVVTPAQEAIDTIITPFLSDGALILPSPKKPLNVHLRRKVFADLQITKDMLIPLLEAEPLTTQFVVKTYYPQSLDSFVKECDELGRGIPPSLQHAIQVGDTFRASIIGLGTRSKR